MTTLDPKDPNVDTEYAIDWYDELVPFAERERPFDVGAIVQFEPDTGWLYECTTAGRTGARMPRTPPRVAGQTLVDGSVIWTCRHPDGETVALINTADWDVPSGITLVSQAEVGSLARVVLSGGTAGEDYDITCRMTPTTGEIAERTITIPVRSL